jgi:hypothetical protein
VGKAGKAGKDEGQGDDAFGIVYSSHNHSSSCEEAGGGHGWQSTLRKFDHPSQVSSHGRQQGDGGTLHS